MLHNLSEVYYLQGNNRLLNESDYKYLEGKISLANRVKKILFSIMSDKLFNKIRNLKRRMTV